ncbi:MAG: hypothetical protein P8X97_00670 [Candidatus Bathyarchaeota archaeon]
MKNNKNSVKHSIIVITMGRENKKRSRKIGIEAVAKPGYESIYVRGTWMKKLKDLGTQKRKPKKIR